MPSPSLQANDYSRIIMDHLRAAYEHADKAITHYQRLLAGHGLTASDKRTARLLLIKAVFQRSAALTAIQQSEQIAA